MREPIAKADMSLLIEVLQNLPSTCDLNKPDEISAVFAKTLDDIQKNPHTLHGTRTELMFGYLAKELGNCEFISQIDSGFLYTEKDTIRPDYRLILKDKSDFFVEVKNNRGTKSLLASLKIKKSYIEQLLNYPQLSLENLKIAIYWSHWKEWTLTPIKNFKESSDNFTITMEDALFQNELGLLGDIYFVGTSPLRVELIADVSKSRLIEKSDESQMHDFTVKDIQIYTGKGLVEKGSVEAKIIFDLIFYGLTSMWQEVNYADIKDNKIIKIIFEYTNQEKQTIISSFSRIITNKYNLNTAPNGKIMKLKPNFVKELYLPYLQLPVTKRQHLAVLKPKIKVT